MTSPGMVAAVNFWGTLLKDGYANKEVITQCQSTNIPQLVAGAAGHGRDRAVGLPHPGR